ncbi:dephospho-CoA kinase [Terrisporobacter sp.]|uniref:dephospho-CoA kinase n=1 Tax=Terrisporobacter sp. TaxID=1965305 RepID=UPI00262584E8|nr:dephospho-CoA kinase [Terrisporobacter sp.]
MIIIGLTGNIGCGKSSLSTIFIQEGIDIVDADIVARQIFEDKELLNQVFDIFGSTIKNEDNTLNRKALANIVFNDDKELVKLNNLTHPAIRKKILNEIENLRIQNKKVVILDAALLIESDYLNHIDKLVLVKCDEKVQIERIKNRDNCTEEEAISRIKSQMSQSEKEKYADYIIDNTGTFDELKEKASILINYIKENWSE